MENGINAKEIGYERGKGLENIQEGRILVDSIVRKQIEDEQEDLKKSINHITSRIHQKVEKISKLAVKNERYQNILDKLLKEREERPTEYALFKGLLYLSLSIVLLLADVSLLGRATAGFLDIPWKDENTGKTFVQLLFDFNNFAQTFKTFPDLLTLTISVLLIGLFYKVWSDLAIYSLDDNKAKTKYENVNYYVNTILLVLSFIMIILMAFSRFSLKFGEGIGVFPNIVAAFIGVTLPFVSMGFFIKGADNIGKRIIIWQYQIKQAIQDFIISRIESEKYELENQLNDVSETLRKYNSEKYLQELLATKKIEYTDGYYEGIVHLFRYDDTQSLSQKIKPLLIKEYLSQR